MQPFREIVNDKLVYHFHPGQLRTFASRKRFTAMLAGTQGGKTCIGSLWLHQKMQELGPGDYLAVEATYDLFALKMLPEMQWYFCETLKIGKYWAQARVIEIAEDFKPGNFKAKSSSDPMWTRIILRSAEAEAGLESATAKAAWLDEAGMPEFSRRAWEAVQRRLSLSQGPVLFTTTLYDWGWFKVEVYDRWEKHDPDYEVIQFDSTMNPAFPRAEYDRAERTLPHWKFDLFYRGRYAKPAGLIYDSFNESTCKIKRLWDKPPKDWPIYIGHDFGPIHTSALWYAQEPNTGYMYLYRTYLSYDKMTPTKHVENWKELSVGENIRKRIGGAGGKTSTDEGWREAYRLADWPVSEPVIRDVELGILRVYAWHKTDHLFVFEDLFDYIAEKQSYSRKLDLNYNPTDEIKDKSVYHLMDGERSVLSDFTPETVTPEATTAVVQDMRPSHNTVLPSFTDDRSAYVQSFRRGR
jgi:hypothetical protein